MERVLNIEIEIDRDDWDTLRNQTRTFEDVIAEIEEFQLSRPFASIYDWFSATVTVDGETHTEVGIRKKGFLGSQSNTKPALKLRFDKYVDDQALGGAVERMTLNNVIQDPSFINTCLTLQVFAAAGLPASRCNFATITVNGKMLGLYAHVEEIKKPFLSRYFDDNDGNLYEGTISDFTAEYRGTIEKKTNEKEDDWADIDAIVARPGGHVRCRYWGVGRDCGHGPIPYPLGHRGAGWALGRIRRQPQQLPVLPGVGRQVRLHSLGRGCHFSPEGRP